jgi:hypothetical protein
MEIFMSRAANIALAVLAGACAVVACNLDDPLAVNEGACRTRSDCNGRGECSSGVCECDPGYTGDSCGACTADYNDVNGTCVPAMTNGGTNGTTTCSDSQIELNGECVQDLCADEPCGPGDCSQTQANAYECACPDGSTTQDSCAACTADSCVHGTCNTDTGGCDCEEHFDGPTCDTCSAGYQGDACDECVPESFGDDCMTCERLYDAEPWWDASYGARSAVVVQNTENIAIDSGVPVSVTFDHAGAVEAGAMANGDDLRVVLPGGEEIDRILGPNSDWNLADTTVLFANQASIDPGQYNVVYAYLRSDTPEPPLNDATNVLLPERGWAYDAIAQTPLYSAQRRATNQMSVQFRQIGVQQFELFVRDASNPDTDTVTVEIRDDGGATLQESVVTGDLGTATEPGEYTEEVQALPRNFRVVIQTSSAGSVSHWFGPTEYTATGDLAQNRSFEREFPAGPPPEVMRCDPELQP